MSYQDFSRVSLFQLYVGAHPPPGRVLHLLGFHTVALCALERQEPPTAYPKVLILPCPLEDEDRELSSSEEARVWATARAIAQGVAQGKRTLVSCQMGINRSALVTGIALHCLTGWEGRRCVSEIQQVRDTFWNPSFRRYVKRIPARS